MATIIEIEALLQKALSPEVMTVLDESHLHQGHAGWKEGGGSHFRVRIIAAAFKGKTRVERHRMVNNAVKSLFSGELHAMALETLSPDEV